MGAQLWYNEAPWHHEAAEALKTLQVRFAAENYNLRQLLPEHIASQRELVAWTEKNDPYDFLDSCKDHLNFLEKLAEQPIPDSPEEQIEMIRLIWGDEVGNVLDVMGLSEERETHLAQRLSDEDMLRLIGTTQPTRNHLSNAIGEINNELRRGECVYFPIYETGEPAAWYFIGNTVD